MSGADTDESEKSHEPTPQKLLKAREKGDVARSADLAVAASYGGVLLAAIVVGGGSVLDLGGALVTLLDQPDRLATLAFQDPASGFAGGLLLRVGASIAPWFAIPALCVLLAILAQRGLVLAPSKLRPKLSRVSIIGNARNKFGPNGLFEFFKSFAKLALYSALLGLFLKNRMDTIVPAAATDHVQVAILLARMSTEFLTIVLVIATGLGMVDAVWQHQAHIRRNRMTRKEVQDETRDAEGDPHMKNERRNRAREVAMARSMAQVPTSDVVIVNPTHYAVALKWSRRAGSAPVCVAKGVDAAAANIRRIAAEAGVPVHSDPATARAIYATVDIGREIDEEHYPAVAAAIRFAERMRTQARRRIR